MNIEQSIREIKSYWMATYRLHECLQKPVRVLVAHVERNGWIPVEESLPEVDADVLLYSESKYGVRQGRYDGNGRWRDCFDNSAGTVTHWKPLDPPNARNEPRDE